MTLILRIGNIYDAETKNRAHMTLILGIGHI